MRDGFSSQDCLRRWTARWMMLVVGCSLPITTPLAEENKTIAVIVPAQPRLATGIHANELALVFWRKKLYAEHGKALRPANLSTEHPLRLRFSEWVLKSNPLSQVAYWNGLYFHGIQPPYTVQSEEAMIRFVADTENAVGYIDACHVDERIRAILWVQAGKVFSEPPAFRCDNY